MSFWERYGCDIVSGILLVIVIIVLVWVVGHYVAPAVGWEALF